MSKLKTITAALIVTASLTGLTFTFNTLPEQASQIAFDDVITPDGRDRVVMPPA